jgi:hypothetical protein
MKQLAVHKPEEQTSPAAQVVPLGAVGLEHAPVAGLQIPALWQASEGLQITGLEPWQEPAWQV